MHNTEFDAKKASKLISMNNDFFDGNDYIVNYPNKQNMHSQLCGRYLEGFTAFCAVTTVRYGVLMVERAQNTVLWDVTPYNLVESQ
jgi:hypothetical protein